MYAVSPKKNAYFKNGQQKKKKLPSKKDPHLRTEIIPWITMITMCISRK